MMTGSEDDDEVGGYGHVANIIPIMIACGRSSIKRILNMDKNLIPQMGQMFKDI